MASDTTTTVNLATSAASLDLTLPSSTTTTTAAAQATSGSDSNMTNLSLIIAFSIIVALFVLGLLIYVFWRLRQGHDIVDVLRLRRRPHTDSDEDWYDQPKERLNDRIEPIQQTRRWSVRSLRFLERRLSSRHGRSANDIRGDPSQQLPQHGTASASTEKPPMVTIGRLEPVPKLPAWIGRDAQSNDRDMQHWSSGRDASRQPEMLQLGGESPEAAQPQMVHGRLVMVPAAMTSVSRLPSSITSGRNSPAFGRSSPMPAALHSPSSGGGFPRGVSPVTLPAVPQPPSPTLPRRSSLRTKKQKQAKNKDKQKRPPPLRMLSSGEEDAEGGGGDNYRASWATTADAPPTPKYRLERKLTASSDKFAPARLQMERVVTPPMPMPHAHHPWTSSAGPASPAASAAAEETGTSGASTPTRRLIVDTTDSGRAAAERPAERVESGLERLVRKASRSRRGARKDPAVEARLKKTLALREAKARH